METALNDDQLLRYSRHILLPEIDVTGQRKLLDTHVLVIGAGGLGSPVALYLAAAGIGTLSIADSDAVDLTNLQRQIMHRVGSVGRNKALSAQQSLAEVNPECRVVPIPRRLEGEDLEECIGAAQVVVDASDNFATRHAINRACHRHRKPLVSGSAIRFDGQVTVFDFRTGEGPCYHCLFPEDQELDETRCAVMGILAPVVGIIGCVQATETIKLITGVGKPLGGRLLLLDAKGMEWHQINLARNPDCPVCAEKEWRK
jgi:adenylyltransferase/sulfurtransferase